MEEEKKMEDEQEANNQKNNYKKITKIILIETIILIIISLYLKSAQHSFKFIIAYLWLYFLPALPLTKIVRYDTATTLVLLNMTGISTTALTLFTIGHLITPLNTYIFLTTPVFIFLLFLGISKYHIKKENQ